mgnify:CR=1 FL=1
MHRRPLEELPEWRNTESRPSGEVSRDSTSLPVRTESSPEGVQNHIPDAGDGEGTFVSHSNRKITSVSHSKENETQVDRRELMGRLAVYSILAAVPSLLVVGSCRGKKKKPQIYFKDHIDLNSKPTSPGIEKKENPGKAPALKKAPAPKPEAPPAQSNEPVSKAWQEIPGFSAKTYQKMAGRQGQDIELKVTKDGKVFFREP